MSAAADRKSNMERLNEYHRKLRQEIVYIHGPARLWYLKRGGLKTGVISRSSLTMTFAIMHRLSELARYDPLLLSRHFDGHHNWLLSEFLATAPYHFLDEISSELTGHDFMIPGRKGVI